jgi:hypothetical protein
LNLSLYPAYVEGFVEGCLERIGETTSRETALPGPLGGQNPAGCSNSKPTTIFRIVVGLGTKTAVRPLSACCYVMDTTIIDFLREAHRPRWGILAKAHIETTLFTEARLQRILGNSQNKFQT